jgi:hypothetical protein
MTVTCPNCGHSGKLSSNLEQIPRRIKCPRCGGRFEPQPDPAPTKSSVAIDPDLDGLPDAAIDLDGMAEPEPVDESEPTAPIHVGNLKIDDSDDEIPARMMPPPAPSRHPLDYHEPWYYRFLDGWGMLYMSMAILLLVGAAVVFTLAVVYGGGDAHIGVAFALWSALGAAGLVTLAAAIFLIVDVARNVRRQTLVIEQTAKT